MPRNAPKTRAGGQWSEARFWGFLRSGLRQLSVRWPPRAMALRVGRRPSQSANKRLKWEHQCAECHGWFAAREIEIDHLEGVGTGTFRSWEDFARFGERLFCEPDKLRKLCVGCNQSLKLRHLQRAGGGNN